MSSLCLQALAATCFVLPAQEWGNTHPDHYSTGYAAVWAAFADFGIVWVGPFAVNSR
jgi:hypothetical protein